MLTTRPGLHELVKARALQSLNRQMQRYPSMWRDKGLRVRAGGRDKGLRVRAGETRGCG